MFIHATMILDNALPHEVGTVRVDQLVTPADVAAIAEETLSIFERYYCPSRMVVALSDLDLTECLGQITFDESGTWSVEYA